MAAAAERGGLPTSDSASRRTCWNSTRPNAAHAPEPVERFAADGPVPLVVTEPEPDEGQGPVIERGGRPEPFRLLAVPLGPLPVAHLGVGPGAAGQSADVIGPVRRRGRRLDQPRQ